MLRVNNRGHEVDGAGDDPIQRLKGEGNVHQMLGFLPTQVQPLPTQALNHMFTIQGQVNRLVTISHLPLLRFNLQVCVRVCVCVCMCVCVYACVCVCVCMGARV